MMTGKQRDMEAVLIFMLTAGIGHLWAQTDIPPVIPADLNSFPQEGKLFSVPEKRDLANQLQEESIRDRKALSGFLGMRGKKNVPSPIWPGYGNDDGPHQLFFEDFLSKRAPSGFFGMRGKKTPSGFFGMRGKKTPSGFLGMRGKKAEMAIPNEEDNDNSGRGDLNPWTKQDLLYLMNQLQRQQADGYSEETGGEPFVWDESGLHHLMSQAKRAPSQGFMGMRGKRHAANQRGSAQDRESRPSQTIDGQLNIHNP